MDEELNELIFRSSERRRNLEQLARDHPALFAGKQPPERSWLPSGWVPIVDRLCTEIEHTLDPETLVRTRVSTIGEKFGLLKFSVLPHEVARSMRLQVDRARAETEQTCEDCGEAGTLRRLPALVVLCDRCETVRRERSAQALDRMRNE